MKLKVRPPLELIKAPVHAELVSLLVNPSSAPYPAQYMPSDHFSWDSDRESAGWGAIPRFILVYPSTYHTVPASQWAFHECLVDE